MELFSIRIQRTFQLVSTEQAKRNHIPIFMKEDLLPIMGEDRMIQELPEQFIEKIWKRK